MNHLRHPIARTFALTGLLITLSACSSLNDLSQLMGSVTPVAKPAAKEIVLINGKDLKIIDTGGDTVEPLTLVPKAQSACCPMV